MILVKGEIILKQLLVSSDSSKKYLPNSTKKTNLIVRFLEESEDTKKSFRNYLTFRCNQSTPLFFLIRNGLSYWTFEVLNFNESKVYWAGIFLIENYLYNISPSKIPTKNIFFLNHCVLELIIRPEKVW